MTLKKALVAITVVAMLFGMVSTAFAAGFADVEDSTTAAAATRLNALNILRGYEDGSFKPANNITRAEFAAVAVRALGLDSAASFAKGATRFSDVAADHWAAGYVNIATQQGVISGYPDGTFGPERQVTYAEALTMIVRVLGYGPLVEGKGIWPANYIAKAAQIGVSNGVAVSASGSTAATRGDVALFVDNSLTIPLMVESGVTNGEITYSVDNTKNLLKTFLGATAYDGTLIEIPGLDGAADNAIKVVTADGDKVLSLGSVDVARLLGHKITAWVGADKKVFLVEDKTPSSSVKTGTIVDTTLPADGTADGISVTYDSVTVDLSSATLVRNFEATGTVVGDFTATDEISVIYDGRAVAYVVGLGYVTGQVDSTSATYTRVYFDNGTALNLDQDVVTYSGAATKFEDIKAGDVLQYAAIPGGYLVVVTRNAKSGALTKLTATSFYLDGVAYKRAGQSTDAGNAALDPYAFDGSLGKAVTLHLNKDGKVAAVEGAAPASKTYAVVTTDAYIVPTADGRTMYAKFLKADGTKATLKFAYKATVETVVLTDTTIEAIAAGLDAGEVAGYTLNSDGEVNSLSVYADVPSATTPYTVNKYNHTITDGTAVNAVSSNTPIFVKGTDGSYSVISRAQLEAAKHGATVNADVALKTDSQVVNVMVISGDIIASTNQIGIVAGKYVTADGYFVTVISGGSSKDFGLDGKTTYDGLTTGDVVSFFADASDISAIDVLPATGWTVDSITVGSVDTTNMVIYSNDVTPVPYFVIEDTQVFDFTGTVPGAAALGNVAKDNTVDIYTDGDGLIQAVVING